MLVMSRGSKTLGPELVCANFVFFFFIK